MNSFEQNTTNRKKLTQIIDNLTFINDNVTVITALERDVILQNLREAYTIVLQFDLNEDVKSEEKIVKSEEIISENVKVVPAVQPETEKILEKEIPMVVAEPQIDTAIEENEMQLFENEQIAEENEVIADPIDFDPAQPEEEETIEEIVPKEESQSIRLEEETMPEEELQSIQFEEEIEAKESTVEEEITAPYCAEECDCKSHSAQVSGQAALASSTILGDESDILDLLSAKILLSDDDEIGFEKQEFEKSVPNESKKVEKIEPQVIKEEKQPIAEPIVEAVQEVKEEIVINPKPQATLNDSLFPEETISDTFRPNKVSLNDILIQQKEDNSLANKFQNRKVEDLAKAISINDKFLFIKELFRNKGEEFSLAIQKLNKSNNIEEAFEEIELLKKYYFWDTTTAAYLALCDLVRRKFQQ